MKGKEVTAKHDEFVTSRFILVKIVKNQKWNVKEQTPRGVFIMREYVQLYLPNETFEDIFGKEELDGSTCIQ